jgi:hypothetical protein
MYRDQFHDARPKPRRSVERFRAVSRKLGCPPFPRRFVHLTCVGFAYDPGQKACGHRCFCPRDLIDFELQVFRKEFSKED